MSRDAILSLICCVLLALGVPALAETWNGGGGDDNWTTGGNWVGGVAPASSNTTDTILAGTTRLTPVVDTNNPWVLHSLTFNSGSGAFSLSGNPLDFTAGGNIIVNSSSTTQTIGNEVRVGASAGTINAASGALVFNGPMVVTGTPFFRGGQAVTINGLISGTGGISRTDSGTLTLSNNANNFTGNVLVAHGVLNVGTIADSGVACALGAGNTITLAQKTYGSADTGTLRYTGGSASTNRTIVMQSDSVAGDPTIEVTTAGTTLTFNGNFQYSSGSTDGRWFLKGAGDGVINGNITTTGAALYKQGAGTWTLNGANTYTGTTVLDQGVLILGSTGGPAIVGAVQMGAGNTNQPHLRMAAADQFGPGVVMSGGNGTNNYARFDLQGFNQTLAGLVSTNNALVVQNERYGGGGTSSAATLTLNGAGTYSHTGYLRDEDDGGRTYQLSIVKEGTGTQTFSGGYINYWGSTTVNEGRLVFQNTTAMANGSSTASFDIGPNGILEFNGAQNIGSSAAGNTTFTGTGTLLKTGTGMLALGNQGNNTFKVNLNMTGGLIDIQGGSIRNGGWQGGVWTNNKASMNIASGATFDIWDGQAVTIDALTGDGRVDKGHATGSTMVLNVGVNGGSGDFSGQFTNSSGAGAISLVKTGSGTQTLSGTADNVGLAVTANAGTLILAKASSAGVHAVGGGGLTVGGGTVQLGGTGGDQILDGARVTVNSGTLDMAGLSETVKYLAGSGGSVSNSGATQSVLTLNQANCGGQTYSGTIDGDVRLVVQHSTAKNSDVQTLTGANTFAGGLVIDNGHVRINAATNLGAVPGSLDPDNITLTNAGVLQNNNTDPVLDANRGITLGAGGGQIWAGWSKSFTVNGPITGSGSLIKADSGTVLLTNTASDYSGGTTVTAGLLRASDRTIGAGGLTLQSGGILFNVSGSGGGASYYDNDFGKAVTLGAGGGGFRSGWGAMTLSGPISGVGSFTIVNDGVITVSNTANSYDGNTTIGAGGSGNNATIQLGASEVIPHGADKGNLVFNASSGGTATFNLAGYTETINGLSSGGSGACVINNSTGNGLLRVGANDANGSFAGTIQNSGGTLAVVKIGTGTLTLSGANSYTGGTTIEDGTLVLGRANALSTSTAASMTIQADGVLDLGGFGQQINGHITGTGTITNNGASPAGLVFGQDGADTVFNGVIADGTSQVSLSKGWSKTYTLGGDASNTYTGNTSINNGSLVLAKTVGNAIGGNLDIGGGGDYNNMFVTLSGKGEQIADTGVVTFNPGSSHNSYLKLMGFDETVAGINDSTGRGVIEVVEGENVGSAGSTLILGGGGTYSYNGYMRDRWNGTSGALSLSKTGSGTQTLAGGNITYTGETSVTGGRLVITSPHTFQSALTTVGSGAVVELQASGNGDLRGNTAYAGDGLLLKTGTGSLKCGVSAGTLTANLSPGGVLDVQEGDLNIGWAKGFQANNYGGLNIAGGASYHISDAAVQADWLTGSGIFNNAYNNSWPVLTIGVAGTVDNAAYGVSGNTATFSGTLGGAEVYNGVSVNSFNVVKTGGGTQVFEGNGILYTGTTGVNGGTLLVNGTHSGGGMYTVEDQATLGGNGTITAPVTVKTGGHIAPGTSPGTLAVGALILQPDSFFDVEMSPAAWDLLVTGTVRPILGGAELNLDILSSFSHYQGSQYMILQNDSTNSIGGFFAGLDEGASIEVAGAQFTITYEGGTGNDIVLTAVPEPASAVLLMLAVPAVAARVRRRLRGRRS